MPTKTQPAASGRQRIEEEITDRILKLLDQGQLPPWERGWSKSPRIFPRNAVSMKPYQGINHFMTLLTQETMGYDDHRWLTYRQAQDLGGHVRRGESGTLIIFWKYLKQSRRPEDGEGGQDNGYEREIMDLGTPAEHKKPFRPMLRTYRVFNLVQTEGCQVPPLEREKLRDHDPIAAAQDIAGAMFEPPAIETYRTANCVPHYAPAKDIVRIPELGRFEKPEEYYDTLFHELVHSTGHPRRLARFGLDANAQDLHAYGQEEMVAAMGAAMLAGHAGLPPQVVERDASYLRHWRDAISADRAMIIRAAAQAEKAVNAVRGERPPEPENNQY